MCTKQQSGSIIRNKTVRYYTYFKFAKRSGRKTASITKIRRMIFELRMCEL
jgi:hypothetical protein